MSVDTASGPPGSIDTPRRRRRHRDNKVAFVMLAPALALLGVFVIWPLVYAWYVSFFQWNFYQDSVFIGLDNFRMVVEDRVFWQSILRGLRYTAIVVPSILVLAFAFANVVKSVGRRLAGTMKVAIYVPTVISGVIASIVFVLIYEYRQGVLNWVVTALGGENAAWLGSAKYALLALTVPGIWLALGLAALIMLAGLLDIPETYYEAAALEGANWWQRTRYITLPLMKNIMLYLLVTNVVASIQQYELPLVMTGGGPIQSTLLPNLYIFQRFIGDVYVGYSIAAALLLFLVLGGLSAVIFRTINSEKAVDG